jgi:hypothetical protein
MKTIWFKAKKYGWGWYPATWEGWAITLGYVAIVTAGYFVTNSSPLMHVFAFVLTVLLIVVCYKTGETPQWRWGDKQKKN